MNYNKYAIILLMIISILSCRKDTFKDDILDPTDNIGTIVTNLSGMITNIDGDPITDATVQVHQKTVTTNEQGVFLFKQITLRKSGSKLEVTKSNYFNSYRIVYPNKPKEISFVNISLVTKGNPVQFNSSEGGAIQIDGGATVQFNPNTIRNETGAKYNGKVNVFAHWYNPLDSDLGKVAPADLVGYDKNSKKVVLYSYGMMAVELYSTGGTKLQISTGETAKITFPVPSEILDNAPKNIPLWSIDELTGLWKEESTAQLSGNKYIGEVSHFSFWNCDAPTSFINIEGYLKLENGTPLANYPIYIKRDNLYGAYGYTNNVGFFKGLVPNNELLTLIVSHCGVNLIEQAFGPYTSDTNLGDYTVTLTDYTTTMTASLKGCIGEPLNYAYGITNTQLYVSPNLNGNISTIIAGCGALDPEVIFYDGENIMKTDIIAIDKSLSNNDLGDITICDQVQDYIRLSIDGGTFHLIPDPILYVVNGEKIHLSGRISNNKSISFSTDILSVTEGISHVSETQCSSPNINQPNRHFYLTCEKDDPDFSCDQFSVNLLSVDLINGVVTGTFEGYLVSRLDSVVQNGDSYYVEGSFRSTMIESYNEAGISGRIWIDLNGNGTLDPEEEDKMIANKHILLQNLDNNFNVSSQNTSGTYNFDKLKPGKYKVAVSLKEYELTQFQTGDPDKDNDFIPAISNYYNFTTQEIVLGDGEVLEHIDVGIKKPEDIILNVSASGCKPDFKIAFSFHGGLMPYTLELSNGMSQVLTTDNWGKFIVDQPGNYTITITDVLGNMTTNTVYVIGDNNVVQGTVWLDKDGGTPDLHDNNDEKLKNIIVTLRRENGTKWAEMPSNKYGYKFVYVPEGTYYIEVQQLAGHSLTAIRAENNGSKINESTYKSDLFTFTSCREFQYLSIGFKKD